MSYLIKILHTIHITPTLVYKVTTDIPRLLFLLHNYVLTPILRIINSLKEIDKGRFSETKNTYVPITFIQWMYCTVFWYSFVNQTHTIIHLRFFRALGKDQFSWKNTVDGISYTHDERIKKYQTAIYVGF